MSEGFEDKDKATPYLKYSVLLLVVIVGGIMLFSNNTDSMKETSSKSSVIKEGENRITNTDTYVAINKELYDEMMNYFNAENLDALNRMEARGDLYFVPKGTGITVVERGMLKTKVEIIEAGIRGYIISEFIE